MCIRDSHFAERFAIDWVQLDEEKRLYTGDQTKVESYPYYGAEVHAVADGVVVATLDGQPTQTPGASPAAGALTIDQYGGNYVCLLYTSPSPRDRTRSRMPSSA